MWSGCRDLYQFWGDRLARQLTAETGFVLNLASKEYSKAVHPHLPESIRFLICTFGKWKNGKVMEKGVQRKMAGGQMVRWMAEQSAKFYLAAGTEQNGTDTLHKLLSTVLSAAYSGNRISLSGDVTVIRCVSLEASGGSCL